MKRSRHKKQRDYGNQRTRGPTVSEAVSEVAAVPEVSDATRQVELVRKQNRVLFQGNAPDGYQNRLAGLGEASPLISDGTWVRNGLTWNEALLTTLYRESWSGRRWRWENRMNGQISSR